MRMLLWNLPKMASSRPLFTLNHTHQLACLLSSNATSSVPIPKHKLAIAVENNTAYKYLKSQPKYATMFFDPNSLTMMAQSGQSEVVNRFSVYASNEKDFENQDFDAQEVDFVLSQTPKLSDQELKAILYYTTRPINLPSPDAPNFERFWRRLDEECATRARSWNYNDLFTFSDLWHINRLFRYTTMHWFMVKKMFRKCERLSPAEFIRFLFSLNLVRRIPEAINTYELEHCLSAHIDVINGSEAGIAAMAFFKTKTSIHDYDLFCKFMELVMSESITLDSVFVSSVAKLGRLSGRGKTSSLLYSFQEAFLPEVGRLDLTSAMHLAIIGTRTCVAHEEIMHNVLRKAENNIERLRLKDMERLLLALMTFDIDCESFCHKVIEQLRSPNREQEMKRFGKTLPSILYYISMKEIYPYDLINKVLDKEFLVEYFGRDTQKYQRELLCLDFSVGLDCQDYTGNRLTEKLWKSITRVNLLWLWPETHERVSAYEHSVRTAAQYLRGILGGPDYVYTCNLLPQFHSAELIFFMDKTNRPVKIPERFRNVPNHEVKYVPTEDLPEGTTAHAILICGYNSVVRNRPRKLLGQVNLQKRQLTKIGYNVHVVYPEEINFEAKEDTQEFRKSRTEFFRKMALG